MSQRQWALFFFSLSLSFSCDVVSSNMYLVVVSMGSQCRMCYAAAETSRQPHRHSTYAYGESDEGNFTNMDRIDFWGPASNFGIPMAAVMDTQKSPDLYVLLRPP